MKKTCQICKQDYSRLSVHVKKHGFKYEDYLIEFVHNGTRPKCACGCGNDAPFTASQGQSFKKYIHSHNATGRKVSSATRKKIGEKNKINMKNYYRANPEKAKEKGQQLTAGRTPEVEAKRIAAVKHTYENLTDEQRKSFGEHATNLWKNKREEMTVAHKKAGETFTRKYNNGEYDFTLRNERLSESITNLYLEGGQQWAEGEYTSSKTGETHNYRSSWELRYMKELDEDNEVKTWEYETIKLPYTFKGTSRHYIPDFMVTYQDDTKVLVEVKPASLTETKQNKAKEAVAREWCKSNMAKYKIQGY